MSQFDDTNLIEMLRDRQSQFVIPIYQRGYNWSIDNVNALLIDIKDFVFQNSSRPGSRYFVGNVITKELPSKPGLKLKRNVIVDGQQRITTTLLIVLALINSNKDEFGYLSELVEVKNKDEVRIKIDRLNDGEVLSKIFKNKKLTDKEKNTNMVKNYEFLFNKFKKEPEFADIIFQGLEKTLLINIILSETENENKVFETINSSGQTLSESDLIKNHIFFYSHSFGDDVEDSLILTFQNELEDVVVQEDLSDFFRYFSAIFSVDKKLASKSKKNAIFTKFKDTLTELNIDIKCANDVVKLLKMITLLAKIWKIISYDKYSNVVDNFLLSTIRNNKNTYFSLFANLQLHFNVEMNELVTKEITRIIAKLALFRSMVGKMDKNITRDVPLIVKNFLAESQEGTLKDFEDWLERTEKVYKLPSSDDILAIAPTLNIYENAQKTETVLRAYELSFKAKGTKIDWDQSFTIEHVMPQNFKRNWYPNIDKENPEEFYRIQQHIHSIGNLTLLTKELNSTLKDDIFKNKINGINNCIGIKGDALQMNQQFGEYKDWNIEAIKNRAIFVSMEVINFINGIRYL